MKSKMRPLFRIFFKNSSLLKQFQDNCFVRQFHKDSTSFTNNPCATDCYGNETKIEMQPSCKVALVTGGATGIGFGIASHILKAGAQKVVITGLDSNKGKEAVHKLNGAFGKNKSFFINSNVTCMIQFEETFKTVIECCKQLDIVVNCAGILDGKNWEREIVTNIIGTIRGTLLAYRYVGKEGSGKGGVVINVAGICGVTPLPPAPTFAACSHAIVGLSRSFGDHLHQDKSGIRVVQLLIGATQTDFCKDIEKRGMSPALGAALLEYYGKAKMQRPEACGQAVVHMITCAPSGSVWLIEGSRLFELTMPHWEENKRLAAQYI